MTKFVSIVSGKGGVGKTTTAINLGAALSSFGKEVLVVDGNLSTPDLGMYLGISRFDSTIHDALKGKNMLGDSVYIHSSGLKFIPGSISLEDAQSADLNRLQKILLDLYGLTDLVLIDSPAGIGRGAESVIKSADEIIVVANPTMASATDALKIAKVAMEHGKNVYGVLVTRTTGKDDISAENIAALLDVPLLGEIPEDEIIKRSVSMKQPAIFSHPGAVCSISYKKIAAEMLGQSYSYELPKKGFFSRLFRKKQ